MASGLYLGRGADASGRPGERLELESRDLLTHAFIVGMTGSGKTGLAVDLIEELLLKGIPVLAIDPKGDLGNLLLLFEKLDAESFEPWIDAETAKREGKTAADVAAGWKQGLQAWGLAGTDIAALEAARDAVIYTPGSTSGVPLNVLGSLEAPDASFEEAAEELRDEIAGIVTGLLGLIGIEADPLQSRELILLSTLIENAWRSGKGLALESLITGIADPPFDRLGALPLESVYPRRERQALMLALNNLLASPSFEVWRRGEPLDIQRMLWTPDGKPRLSVLHTAHLSEAERLFVTALVLDKVKTWMRRQGGTSELRAVVYMDEIFGYFPPHPANPPTKRPLLTLLKQARAQGVGVVLATQNPVDLDYKGLANMGTWLVGTLQTTQDRARLREGLQSSGLEPSAIDELMDGTRKRVFLLHDVHRSAPCLLESRWAMSYLRGPLTRDEIARLMEGRTQPDAAAPARAAAASNAPVLPAPFRHLYFAKYDAARATPHLLVKHAVRYKDAGEAIATRAWPLVDGSPAEVLDAEPLDVEETRVSVEPPPGLQYSALPDWLAGAGAKAVEKALRDRLPGKLAVTLFFDPLSKQTSKPRERADAFAERLAAAGGGGAAQRLAERLDKKRRELATEEQNLTGRKSEKWVAIGSAILSNIGLLTGRKRTVSGASTVLTKNRMENNAEARVEGLKIEIAEIESQLQALAAVDPARFEAKELVPARADVTILRYDILWVH